MPVVRAQPDTIAEAQVRRVVENWVLYRDAADWDAFATVWHDDGWMTATWFQGPYRDFIEASRSGFEAGVEILHFLGGFTCELRGDRGVAQTKVKIEQRAPFDGVLVDVTCTGRFFDFVERRDGAWGIVRRQPIYEKDRLDVVDPAGRLALDATLDEFPVGYRHLAYVQRRAGFEVRKGLPGLRGPEVEMLYREGREWLDGARTPGVPLGAAAAR